ncbi:MAG: SpoIIE family protein phosphatase [Acidobacteriota bacterium]|nr:SpoIIE family protein phosphatase [Acidobacteriota bacterium]MDH3785294.1 SpoIIE family protein phosphatase [Acidobacteriota bacterium]
MKSTQSPIQTSGESRSWNRFRLDCASLSAAGAGRSRNEDQSLFAAPGTDAAEQAAAGYLFAVVDGETTPGVTRSASRETRTSLLEILDDPRRAELRPDLMLHRLHDANDRCHQRIGARCSVTAVWLWEDPRGEAAVAGWAHVGDTRLYHLVDGRWQCLTEDHAKGRVLDRAIGQGPGLEIETGAMTLKPGEKLILVTRGVWQSATPAAALTAPEFPPTAEAARQLVGQARLNGSREDTTAIVISVGNHDDEPEPEH